MTDSSHPHDAWKIEAASTVVAAAAILGGWALELLNHPGPALGVLLVAYVAGGWDALRTSVSELREGKLDVDLLMLMAAGGAAVVDHWLEGAILLFLFSTGNTLETFAFGRTRRSIQALMSLRPEEASVVENGIERLSPVEDLLPGQVIRVRPGERIAADGVVLSGHSRVDQSTLTGESVPVSKEVGEDVFAGTLNGAGSLDIEVTRPANDTALARVIRMVEDAREAKAPTQGWIERMESRYAIGVIAASTAAIFIPWLVLGWPFDDALYRAMTLLVVASPCALVISIPATIVSAVSNGARKGVLFKGGLHLDALATVRAMALDKTGTITVGRPELVGMTTTGPIPRDEVLRLVASAESRSEHHLATAIVRGAETGGLALSAPESFQSVAGQGVTATVDGRIVQVGRASWIATLTGASLPQELVSWAEEDDRRAATPVFAAIDGAVLAALAVADHPREGVADALDALRELGITHLAMLTGDHPTTARFIADSVGIEHVYAELLPEEKGEILSGIRRDHGPVAMVGDGVNDAPALAAADVGIALGGAGTDVALETADVVVMGEGLAGLAHAVELSHRAQRVVRQNLVFATSVMVVLVVLALFGRISLTTGVVGHEGSTVIVVFNGLRLLGERRRKVG
ncbi:MAG: heavy metal translocating P-type ATPase [Gemmatimonadota bacterium]|nr:heavy metal translocating P-type ATPase [Gemmatimonadota bacterium]MDH5758098.1 heavy metal translocating P-type ATPase [Gemmatimonadota bacterium]